MRGCTLFAAGVRANACWPSTRYTGSRGAFSTSRPVADRAHQPAARLLIEQCCGARTSRRAAVGDSAVDLFFHFRIRAALPNPKIPGALFVSLRTAETHLTLAYRKLTKAHSSKQAFGPSQRPREFPRHCFFAEAVGQC